MNVKDEGEGAPPCNAPADAEGAGPFDQEALANMTPGQRAALGADKLDEWLAKNPGVTIQQASTDLGRFLSCSATCIHYAKAVKRRDSESYQLLKDGKLNVGQAYKRSKRPGTKPLRAQPLEQRLAAISRLANEGNSSVQIADAIGLSPERVRELSRKNGIQLADAAMGHRPRINIHRVIEETVSTLEGLALGLRTIDGARLECESDEARQWVSSIDASLRVIGRVRKILRGSYE